MATTRVMPPSKADTLDEREEWILRLLYAPNEDGSSCPIYGKTRIMKAVFLLQQKLEEHFNTSVGFDFRPHKYGPFDEGVYETLGSLDRSGLINRIPEDEHGSDYEGTKFELTESGYSTARDLHQSRSDGEKRLLYWVKYKQSMRSLGALLSYVYMEYPEMTTESELV